MKALVWLKRMLLLAFVLVVGSNVLVPAVARAQWARAGGASVADVLTALLAQDVSFNKATATASTGSGYACSAALSSCVDLGPGANNGVGTNGSGHVVIGTGTGTATVNVGEDANITMSENGNLQIGNGALILNNSTTIFNQTASRAVAFNAAFGIDIAEKALGTCAAAREASIVPDVLAGAATGNRTRLCICVSDGASTYKWHNLGNFGDTSGTATTCPN